MSRVFAEATRIAGVEASYTKAVQSQAKRIVELETALNRMICAHENLQADTEGKYPPPDCGCVYCSQGQVPDKLNTGPCALHNAKQLLGQL